MKKIITILMSTAFISLWSSGQTVPEKLNKLKNDPKTKLDAAKADSFLINKKIIFTDTPRIIKPLATKRKQKIAGKKSTDNSTKKNIPADPMRGYF